MNYVPKFYVLAPNEIEGPFDTEAEARGQAHFRGLDVAISEAPPPGGQVAGLRVLSADAYWASRDAGGGGRSDRATLANCGGGGVVPSKGTE